MVLHAICLLQDQYQGWFDELGCESQLVDLQGNVFLIAAALRKVAVEATGRL